MSELSFPTVDSATPESSFKRGDVVKMYKEGTHLEFPYVLLYTEKLEMFRVDALKGILGNRSLIQQEDMYNVYVAMPDGDRVQTILIGILPSSRLKYIKGNKVFSVFDLTVVRWKDDLVEGDMVYALCPTSSNY